MAYTKAKEGRIFQKFDIHPSAIIVMFCEKGILSELKKLNSL